MSLADVTSANVVGYQNYPLRNGSTMTGASFQTIASEGVHLTDLTPVGYLNNSTWTKNITGKGCQGYIRIQVLTKDGKIDTDAAGNNKEYLWYHTYSSKKWQNDACWKQRQMVEGEQKLVPITTDNDEFFDRGLALWIQVTQNWEESMAIVYNGEAMLPSRQVPLRNGSTALCAPLSSAVKLTDIKAVGYLNNATWTKNITGKGCQGYIRIQVLTKEGKLDTDAAGNNMEYLWYHTYSSKKWQDDACWKQRQMIEGEQKLVPITTDNDVEFKMGEGLWVQVTQNWEETMALEFPGIDDTVKAE